MEKIEQKLRIRKNSSMALYHIVKVKRHYNCCFLHLLAVKEDRHFSHNFF